VIVSWAGKTRRDATKDKKDTLVVHMTEIMITNVVPLISGFIIKDDV